MTAITGAMTTNQRLNCRISSILYIAVIYLMCSAPLVASANKGRVLVLLDSLNMQETHRKFLQLIHERGYNWTVATTDAKSVALKDWDEWLFDKLVILGGSKRLASGLKPSVITEFFNAGGDVFLAFSEDAPSSYRELAASFGVDVARSGTAVIDHFHHNAELATDATAVLSSSAAQIPAVFKSGIRGPVIFKGVGLSVSRESELAFHALTAEATGYSGTPGKMMPKGSILAGPSLGLVTLVQARNNARAAVTGSVAMLSDAFFSAGAGNKQLASDVLSWTLHERGVLKASPLRHRILDGGEMNPSQYRINDMVEVALEISECSDHAPAKCKPYKADDVQIEFVMLDPYIRAVLAPQGNGTFSTVVKIPDTYGVFKWVLDYRRPGLSWINIVEVVPVRPFRHDEYERFIVQAYPYYASTMSMMAGFFALGFLFLYSR